jgi:hypothetical protein
VLATTTADVVTPELAAAIDRMNVLNAWGVDSEAKRMLDAVGLTDPNAKVGLAVGVLRGRWEQGRRDAGVCSVGLQVCEGSKGREHSDPAVAGSRVHSCTPLPF